MKLAPDYPVAHYNLAVYYATAKPPLPRLGDYHYQKAISGGQPKDVKLEVLLGH